MMKSFPVPLRKVFIAFQVALFKTVFQRDMFNFYCCTVYFDNVQNFFTNNYPLY
jgi:hypothetical protein